MGCLAATEAHSEEVGHNIERALDLIGDCGRLYLADSAARRQVNQAFFERLEVDVDGVTETRLTPPFALLLEDKRLERELKNPNRAFCGRGSSKSYLVEVSGLLSNPDFGTNLRELIRS